MKYLFLCTFPYDRGNGVTSYIKSVEMRLNSRSVETHCICNTDGVHREAFRQIVLRKVTADFSPEEWLVESSEIGAPGLLLPPSYRVHVRMHCPSAIVQRYNGTKITRERLADDFAMIRRADFVSAGSHALVHVCRRGLGDIPVTVFKNPPAAQVCWVAPEDRKYDVMFLGKFVPLKGVGFLNRILSALPSGTRVCIAGRGATEFELTSGHRCEIDLHDHIDGPERLRKLGNARVCLSLSRFENCSMVILESLGNGTLVAAWDVGGNREIAPAPLIRLAPYGDVAHLMRLIEESLSTPHPPRSAFEGAVSALAEDFDRGWSSMYRAMASGTDASRIPA